ncbi:MAG: FecR family protein, partial [Alphaproteobacteria bacterium]
MFNRSATLFTVVTIALTSASVAHGQGNVGRAGVAAAVRGNVVLVAAAPRPESRAVGQNVQSGDPVFLGDTIETGPDSGLQIMLMDETIFTIGPDAALIIDEFVYDPETSAGKVTASVLKGAFRFVSGRVAKEEPRNMNVKTPVGTIGIRGTSAAGRVIPANPNDPDSEISADIVLLGPGVDNNANERAGRIIVSNADTSVEISRSGFGTNIAGIDAAPTIPVRFEPSVVSGLTGDLGTNGGARPASRPAAGSDAQNANDQSGGGDGDQSNGDAGPDNGNGSATAQPAGSASGSTSGSTSGTSTGSASGPSSGPAAGPNTAGNPAAGGNVAAAP